MANFGELHTAYVYFKGTEGDFKTRPVLIIDDSEEALITFAEISSVEPNIPPKYFDSFKIEIIEWSQAGLNEHSWVKCHKGNIHRVPKDRVGKYIGIVDDESLLRIIDRIVSQ